jgi:hypothetical protein
MLVGLALVLVAFSFAGAQVTCGDTIDDGQTVTLTADIGPCDTDPSIPPPGIGFVLAVDGGTLDLGGHTLTCTDMDGDGRTPVGIRVRGETSHVMNGTVVGCKIGVNVDDAAQGTQVVHVTARNSSDTGVIIFADNVTLTDVQAKDSVPPILGLGAGIMTLGSNGRLTGLVATNNADLGIGIAGVKNEIIGATATGNGRAGFDLSDDDAKANKLTGCQAIGNGSTGFRIGGRKNKVNDSIANDNAKFGFEFEASQNKVAGGSAYGNGQLDLWDCYANKSSGLFYGTRTPAGCSP